MRVYLADLLHGKIWGLGNLPSNAPLGRTVPLGIAYLAAALNRRMPGMDVRLFRDPDRLLAAAQQEPPHLLGFCFTSWNMHISRRVAQQIKAWSPSTIVVGGGPCVDEQDEQLLAFFSQRPEVDYLVPNEGEHGFVALVAHLEGGRKDGVIPGVAHLDPAGRLVRGGYQVPEVAPAASLVRPNSKLVLPMEKPANQESLALSGEIPSPYLDGTLDPFLEEGLVPIIQTMRGCPYRCDFCVSGTTLWNKPRGFPLERVTAEVEYALSNGRSKDLILTDENWGILGERDVELARYIMRRHQTSGSPRRLYYYTAKIVNEASRAIVETVSPIAWIGEFSISFQSLNLETRQAIKRTNISLKELKANVDWSNERGIPVSSEMIFGLPYETTESFFDGVESLIDAGVHRIVIYPLQLFPGIDLASDTARKDYGLITRFRLAADLAYGAYLNGELISAESEEIVIGTKWFGEDAYYRIRRYAFLHTLLHSRGFVEELFHLCTEAGIPAARLTRYLASTDLSAHPTLRTIMNDFDLDARRELKLTPDEVVNSVARRLRHGEDVGGVKLNSVYLAKVLSNAAAVTELVDLIGQYVSSAGAGTPFLDVALAYAREILPNCAILFDRLTPERLSFETHFDYRRWRTGAYRSLADLLSPIPLLFEADVPSFLYSNLRDFDNADTATLQAIIDTTYGRGLMRTILLQERLSPGSAPKAISTGS